MVILQTISLFLETGTVYYVIAEIILIQVSGSRLKLPRQDDNYETESLYNISRIM